MSQKKVDSIETALQAADAAQRALHHMSGPVIEADFGQHRKEVATDNSPFGPVRSRLVKLGEGVIGSGNIPGDTDAEHAAHPGPHLPIKGPGADERTFVDPDTGETFYDM